MAVRSSSRPTLFCTREHSAFPFVALTYWSRSKGWILSHRWPSKLWIVRHGESAGNVARDAAHAAGLPDIDIQARDVDVPLSSLGQRQSTALGRWFASMPPAARPEIVLSSP